jgi:MYXO-CTERM domain-containing protein
MRALLRGFGRTTGAGLLVALLGGWPAAGPARAFSAPSAYMEGVDVGGGGGRWFTGSSADGYGCNVCHEGAPGAELAVAGLPLEGFVPGTAYEVTVTWPPLVPHVALVAEFTDEQRQGAGTLELPRFDPATPIFERCSGEEDGVPSSDLFTADAGRQLVTVIDCGARMLRFKWTAPVVAPGTVWFNVGFVVSNDDVLPGGDGVTLVAMPLPPAGTALAARTVAQGSCSAARTAAAGPSPLAIAFVGLAALIALRRRSRTSRTSLRSAD